MATSKKAPQKKKNGPEAAHPLVAKFGTALRAQRKKQNLSQKALAHRMDVSVSYVSMLEAGKRNPPLSTVGDVAMALGIQPRSLVG